MALAPQEWPLDPHQLQGGHDDDVDDVDPPPHPRSSSAPRSLPSPQLTSLSDRLTGALTRQQQQRVNSCGVSSAPTGSFFPLLTPLITSHHYIFASQNQHIFTFQRLKSSSYSLQNNIKRSLTFTCLTICWGVETELGCWPLNFAISASLYNTAPHAVDVLALLYILLVLQLHYTSQTIFSLQVSKRQ